VIKNDKLIHTVKFPTPMLKIALIPSSSFQQIGTAAASSFLVELVPCFFRAGVSVLIVRGPFSAHRAFDINGRCARIVRRPLQTG
jgi:hypothetical protein